jgi:hypothetical protein
MDVSSHEDNFHHLEFKSIAEDLGYEGNFFSNLAAIQTKDIFAVDLYPSRSVL